MAKQKQNRSTRSKSGNKSSTGTGLLDIIFSLGASLTRDPESRDQTRRVTAWSLLFICVLSLLACISYFYTGSADQSILESEGGDAGRIQNWLGYIGAQLASLIIYKGFGLFGVLLPIYGMLLSIVLLEDDYYIYVRRIFKYVLFMVLWGSVFLAYVVLLADATGGSLPEHYDLGGGFGYFVNQWLFRYVAEIGVALLLLFGLMIFIVVNFRAEFRASRLVQKVASIGETVASRAPVNRPLRNKSLKQALLDRLGLEEKNPDNSTANGLKLPPKKKSLRTEEEPSQTNQDPEVPETERGTQISLDVQPQVLKKAAPENNPQEVPPQEEKSGLELTIEAPKEEAIIHPPPVPKLTQLGEDNVGMVEGDEETVMKIVPESDQETDISDEVINWEEFDPTKELSEYHPPVLELMEDHGSGANLEVNREELESNKNKIVETLANYGIEIISIKATIGPTVTLYEIVPAPGVRISKIRNLEDDIALSLAALGIRIIAPIPGKGTIGIEVPNSNPETVSLRGVLSTVKFQTTGYELPIAIGRTISNEVFIADLNKMPHLLIAGATGQGKSVGLNTMITSLLYKKHPAEVKFVLIDPKKVEMTLYQALNNHFLAMMPDQEDPIITDVTDAVNVLKSLCIEMDQRYELLKMARVRNLKEYNKKFTSRKLNPLRGHRFLPYIVLVIDELADMMMVAGKEVEMPIARLAQLARAVGIHLIVATQRPSVNVITGVIKANFPARLSYRVISKVDSRTILDANGADQLIGRGDLLLSTGNELIRLQNAFIDTPEVERVVDFIARQPGFFEPYYLPEMPSDENSLEEDEPFEKDSNFEEAARVIVRYQIGSASLIQRKLKLGYNRAGRIIDQLEKANIVGPHSGSKPREVLISDEVELERYLSKLR